MSEIAILTPIDALIQVSKEAAEKTGEDVAIRKVSFKNAIAAAKEFEKAGTEVIISRGTMGLKLIESDLSIPVVQIPITGYDLLRTIKEAQKLGQKVGIADTRDVLQGIETIESVLGLSIEKHAVIVAEEAEAAVETLSKKEIDVLIGKSIFTNKVKNDSIETVILTSGVESVIQAIHEARSLIDVRRIELKRTKELQAILDFIADGVIAVDEKGIITVCNPSVYSILNLPYDSVIGKSIDDILVNSQMKKVLSTGKEELNRIQDTNGVKVVANRIPIRHEQKVFGAVCTFQEVHRLQQQEQEIRKKLLHRGHITKYSLNNIVGESEMYQKAIQKMKKYSQVDSTVLLTGETGVGKEVFAHLIHSFSKRSEGPFVAVNCAAIPENLLESELFGYVEGAFTGAKKGGKTGLFELAHQGTIFLDEIGELAESLQAQLLRVLQEGEVMRLGDERVIPINIRVIAASNRDFEKMVEDGSFRADLYYRLNILDIPIPSLRERIPDIPLLCDFFIKELEPGIRRNIIGFTADAMKIMQSYHWPGNIRQLRNIVERAMILSPENMIDSETVLAAGGKDFTKLHELKQHCNNEEFDEETKLQNYEKEYILNVLKQVNGNKTEAARILGIGRTTLWRKINSL
ncbi:sigma 54-interacting transcriptional regulator [Bacillus sp. CMF12]|uniref:sigma 54-interacting transcriptional regulator n=1 Tax=Bacillaceae TaxID=186817 RepID=UPI001FB27BF8|nr:MULTISPECIES: sigma 54-interacting transcriptional regulator [Bacillaceae]UOE53150.1 sigma 54-interacting transcriptional regulator [Cytobacillus oceanisediminis]USK52360.1 sigma 54-interacting transcriptional regulator [Bacillus sp. CMF12]